MCLVELIFIKKSALFFLTKKTTFIKVVFLILASTQKLKKEEEGIFNFQECFVLT